MEEALEGVKNATNEQDLANRFKEFGKEMVKLNYVAARRQQVTLGSHPLSLVHISGPYVLVPLSRSLVLYPSPLSLWPCHWCMSLVPISCIS